MAILYLILLAFLPESIPAELASKYVSRTGHLHVESHSRYLDVIADNYQVYCELIPSSGEVQIRGLIKSFEFKLGALDRAFNSDRVNLTKYSKFTYQGKVDNLSAINFSKPGDYLVTVKGILYIGDYQRITSASGTLVVDSDGSIRTNTSFNIRIEEESMLTINRMMKEKLPSIIALDADKLGISRDIQLALKATFRPRG